MPATSGSAHSLVAGRYVVERVLGEGATAVVFLARDTEGGRMVAIKLLRPELAQSTANTRFLREIRRTGQLQHPHILPVLDAGETDGRPYFVLPHMEGGTLRQRLKRESQLPIADAIAITRTVAEALDYAHARGLIHRDVKPENILFTGGQACLGDFGIARALETVYGETASTSANIVRGTPAYMSPEQAAGSESLDGRSDLYSLACVFYEMVTGMQAFMGPTPESVIAMRFAHPPRELRVYRPSVPAPVERAVTKALSLAPADRFASATEFAVALEVSNAVTAPQASDGTARPSARRRKILLAGGAFAALAASVMVVMPRTPGAPLLDTARIALLPLEEEGQPPWEGDDLLRQGFSRWRDIATVDQFQVHDAVQRSGPVTSIEKAGRIAQALGAGRYVRGRITPFGPDRWRVSLSLFDTHTSARLYEQSATVAGDISEAAFAYARLTDSLLLRGVPAASSIDQSASRSLTATLAVARAFQALDNWDLVRADSSLQSAVETDPDYVEARLWLAQVRAWQNRPAQTWAAVIERGAPLFERLRHREQRLATALLALAHGRYADACAQYDSLIAANDADFAAWFGYGQCRGLNKRVVQDPASPSGWRFEASAHQMIRGYVRAFEILPSVHRGFERGAFTRLQVLLGVSNTLITGRSGDSLFYARPAWLGDSLVLVPYPWQAVFAGAAATFPPGHAQAREFLMAQFRRLAAQWSAAYPRSAGAKFVVAIGLDLVGDSSAVDTMRTARSLTTDAGWARELAVNEVLMAVKYGVPDAPALLMAATQLADSVLGAVNASSLNPGVDVAALAALLGRCTAIDSFVVVPYLPTMEVPADLLRRARALEARTALGCADAQRGVGALLQEARRRIGSKDGQGPQRMLQVLLYRTALLSTQLDAGVLRYLRSTQDDAVLSAALALAENDRASARRYSSAVDDRGSLPTVDMALARAHIALRLHDTVTAIRTLDAGLGAIRQHDRLVLGDATTMAALLRSVTLRADLAEADRDSRAAGRWRSAHQALRTTPAGLPASQ